MVFNHRHRTESLPMVQRIEAVSAHLAKDLARARLWA